MGQQVLRERWGGVLTGWSAGDGDTIAFGAIPSTISKT